MSPFPIFSPDPFLNSAILTANDILMKNLGPVSYLKKFSLIVKIKARQASVSNVNEYRKMA